MFKSQEIRWFRPAEDKPVAHWFASHGLDFSSVQARTDFYLVLPEKEDVNIKLREGRIEIKHRLDKPKRIILNDHAEGFLENWVKWSFNVTEGDLLSGAIIKDKKYDWVEVYKERMGVILSKDQKGNTTILNMEDRTASGCQVEYTRLLVSGQEYFTFGLEWFGSEYVELDPSLVTDIMKDTHLKPEDSMGYARFLSTNQSK